MKILCNVDFWTINDIDMHRAYYYCPSYYNCFYILRKKYNQLFIRNFYKL